MEKIQCDSLICAFILFILFFFQSSTRAAILFNKTMYVCMYVCNRRLSYSSMKRNLGHLLVKQYCQSFIIIISWRTGDSRWDTCQHLYSLGWLWVTRGRPQYHHWI